MPITTVEIKCDHCGEMFSKRKSEFNRCQKRGLKRHFCSAKCCGHAVIDNLPPPSADRAKHLDPANQLDEYTIVRYHYRNAKKHTKQRKTPRAFAVTLSDLKYIWEKQEGRCALTGWEMIPRYHSKALKGLEKNGKMHPRQASLDRIDSTRGYEPDNVRFVCYMANCAKSIFSDIDVIEFCEAVNNKWKKVPTHATKTQQRNREFDQAHLHG